MFTWWIGRPRLAASLHKRLALLVLLLVAYAPPPAPPVVASGPQPGLHPILTDALSSGFALLVGQAPFAARLWIDDAAGYQPTWELDGAEPIGVGGVGSVVARFDRPGVYFPSVRLTRPLRPTITLSQKIVVLSSAPNPSVSGKMGINQDLAWDFPEDIPTEV